MQVTMMIFILQVKKNQKNPYSVKKLDRDFFIPPFFSRKRVELKYYYKKY